MHPQSPSGESPGAATRPRAIMEYWRREDLSPLPTVPCDGTHGPPRHLNPQFLCGVSPVATARSRVYIAACKGRVFLRNFRVDNTNPKHASCSDPYGVLRRQECGYRNAQ